MQWKIKNNKKINIKWLYFIGKRFFFNFVSFISKIFYFSPSNLRRLFQKHIFLKMHSRSNKLNFVYIKKQTTSVKKKVKKLLIRFLSPFFFIRTWWKNFTAEVFCSNSKNILRACQGWNSSADLEMQLMQLNHCEGVYSNYWNTLLRNLKLSPYINFYV